MDVMLETKDLTKTFSNAQKGKVKAVKGINLQRSEEHTSELQSRT